MQVFIRGKVPTYDDFDDWQMSLLLDPLVEVIKEFYKNPTNRQAYEKWLADGKQMRNKNLKQEVHQYEQLQMSI